MKLKELLAPLDVRELHADPELDITGISYDSRTTQPGELFVAVTGFAADGHKFIPKAVERGAAEVLRRDAGPPHRLPHRVLLRPGVRRRSGYSEAVSRGAEAREEEVRPQERLTRDYREHGRLADIDPLPPPVEREAPLRGEHTQGLKARRRHARD